MNEPEFLQLVKYLCDIFFMTHREKRADTIFVKGTLFFSGQNGRFGDKEEKKVKLVPAKRYLYIFSERKKISLFNLEYISSLTREDCNLC